MLRALAVLLLVGLLAAGCGGTKKKSSNGFGAATQPPPAATGVSTSQATHPTHVLHAYPRAVQRVFMSGCVKSGASSAACGCALKKLENRRKPPPLTAANARAALVACRR
jgi:hypothetical protein